MKTPCKLQGIRKKLLIEGKDKWKDQIWEKEKAEQKETMKHVPLVVTLSSFSYPPIDPGELGVFAPWRFSWPGVFLLSAARGQYDHTEVGFSTEKLSGFRPQQVRLAKTSFVLCYPTRPMEKLEQEGKVAFFMLHLFSGLGVIFFLRASRQ